jgi:type IV pilus assembly protein PilO
MAAAGFSIARLPLAGKIGVGVVLCALVGLGYYVVLHTEVSTRIDNARRQMADLEAQLATTRQAQLSYLADRDDLAMRQQKQRDLNKILPAETEAASFLSALQQVSNVAGIDLKKWEPMEEKTETYFAKVPMRLEVTGKFHQISKFMYEVGKQDRIINMENIELSDPKVQGEEVTLKAKCLATTFHLLKNTKPAGSGAPGTPGAPPGGPPGAPTAPPGGKK